MLGIILNLILLLNSASGAVAHGSYEECDLPKHCVSTRLVERHQLNSVIYGTGCGKNSTLARYKRRVDPTFRGNPKSRADVLSTKFNMNAYNYEQTISLVKLVNKIAKEYLVKCPPVIYYDSFVEKSEGLILETLFKTIPITFYHGEINTRYVAKTTTFTHRIDNNCKSYILFLSDPLMTRKVLGPQTESRVVLVARSTQWKLRDFLSSELSSNIVNLLVIGESLTATPLRERPYVLYTHKLYADGLGSNTPIVLTSWIEGGLSRPHINLFPPKFSEGFAGHRFQVSAANQPPFIFRIRSLDTSGTSQLNWDGVEFRLLHMISKKLNFSIDIAETPSQANKRGVVDNIQQLISQKSVDIGMSGIYLTEDRMRDSDMSVGHSRDCAVFITLASKALPKYRAIMGPFQWPVWVALIFVYLGGVFPIVFTERLTLSHLIGNWGEIENMFWYVFGMFTNSFTFSGKYSWTNTEKNSTRLLIGAYWVFTIIITACYTGSIIAFVTLPSFPDTVDSVTDLLGLFFRVATLDNGGWENWFQNSTHEPTSRLYKKMEFVETLEEGIGNVTQSFFWNYAFIGSKAQLEYLVQANFSDENISRRSALHLSEECFALFQISYIFPKDSVFKRKIDSMILLAQQSGLLNKISNEVSWVMQRSSTGRLLQASASSALSERIQEERQLTTADTEGMFLLMAIGYLVGGIALVSEIVGGITNKCRQIIKRSRKSAVSTNCSSRGSSSDVGAVRTKLEQQEHDERKAARRDVAEREDGKRLGFGIREFNLTRSTLRELYGNYHTAEPNYIVNKGQLFFENESISTDNSPVSTLRNSSGKEDARTSRWHHKKRALVVAQIDSDANTDFLEEEVHRSLEVFDEYLTQIEATDEQCASEAVEDDNDLEQQVFGGPIDPSLELYKLENLNLFTINEINQTAASENKEN